MKTEFLKELGLADEQIKSVFAYYKTFSVGSAAAPCRRREQAHALRYTKATALREKQHRQYLRVKRPEAEYRKFALSWQ
jgi:hypothetical protein